MYTRLYVVHIIVNAIGMEEYKEFLIGLLGDELPLYLFWEIVGEIDDVV